MVITVIKCNYHELTHSADDYKWVWFIAFATQGPRVCLWPSWISQRDVWQRYNERLEQSVTWYVFMEWRAFFCRGPRLNWALWPGQGDTFLSRQKGTVSLAVIVFSTRCLCHRAQSFGNVTKKCIDRKFPQNPTESSATQLPKHRNQFGSFEVIF